MNGLLRQYFPINRDLKMITNEEIHHAMHRLNNRPIKCLDFKTPLEVFFDQPVALTIWIHILIYCWRTNLYPFLHTFWFNIPCNFICAHLSSFQKPKHYQVHWRHVPLFLIIIWFLVSWKILLCNIVIYSIRDVKLFLHFFLNFIASLSTIYYICIYIW